MAFSATAERVAGFRSALAEAGKVLTEGRITTCDATDHVQIGYRCVGALLAEPSSLRQGIFCSSDLIAYGAHRAITERGLRVPEEVMLIGFDDNPLNDWVAPWLTSVRVPYDRFGDAVVRALADIWTGRAAPSIMLEHFLVVRSAIVARVTC